ncbi:hypothetical protein FISHEDRAFT_59438 [Fistulina hepatica ATCC 64428]|uniref:Uncharacterized protein n=1 Tax=Fistulina hepatica ATCC 64428 TaxID=1128425 RepID=A0A0D7ACP3_9AGAR|nr:hypothetical protein FISHEDRAFT_59438 [Fistulina hepatica ATCC 64428]
MPIPKHRDRTSSICAFRVIWQMPIPALAKVALDYGIRLIVHHTFSIGGYLIHSLEDGAYSFSDVIVDAGHFRFECVLCVQKTDFLTRGAWHTADWDFIARNPDFVGRHFGKWHLHHDPK